jgi:polyisoprenoid-binding protein YceI
MTTQALSTAGATVQPGVWNIDPSHSTIGFSVKHMMIATVRGRFTEFSGALTAGDDGAIAIDGLIQAASIDTNESQRDEHLRSADFFDAANHPEIRFASTRVTASGDGGLTIAGELTIKGITREVVLDAELHGSGVDPWGNERVALEAKGEINRKDFELNWNQLLEAGGVLVGEKIKIALDLSTVRSAS